MVILRTKMLKSALKTIEPFQDRLNRIYLFKKAFQLLYDKFAPDEWILVEVEGVKMYVNTRDRAISRFILQQGCYEKGTTKVFKNVVKEVIKLPKNVIEDRFNVDEDEGVAQLFIGYASKYVPGGGFLYTNKETVTLGVVVRLEHAIKNKLAVYDLVEDFRQHPYIKKLIKGGVVIEYAAHLIPESGIWGKPSKLYMNGLLLVGDAAGFTLSTGFTVRGVDLAFWSGVLAAETIKKAHDEGKYPEETLSHYETLLKQSFIINELEAFKRAPIFLSNLRLYETYPKLICEFLREIYTVDGTPKRLYDTFKRVSKGKVSLVTLIRDIVSALRSL